MRTVRFSPDLGADPVGVGVEQGHDPEAVVGEHGRAGDRLAEVAGAEQRDVVLPAAAQDLADLRVQGLDVVAHAPLAELAEARQVAADLGGVDVRVVGQLLRGDGLLAHLARLGQHLEVARQPRGHTQGEPLGVAVDQPLSAGRGLLEAHGRNHTDAPAQLPGVDEVLEDLRAVDLDHRNPLAEPVCEHRVEGDVDLVELEADVGPHGLDHLAGVVAEVAAGLAVEGHAAHDSLAAASSSR